MTSRFLVLLVLVALFGSKAVYAEGGCPPGQYPQQGQGWQTCVPISGNAGATQGTQPTYVPSKWIDRYQAIATDSKLGILGTSLDKPTGQDAIQAALSDCKTKGGTDCRIEIAHGNGCVAMVVGKEFKNVKSGANQKKAELAAMSQCESNDKDCLVYYSACSLPVEVPE